MKITGAARQRLTKKKSEPLSDKYVNKDEYSSSELKVIWIKGQLDYTHRRVRLGKQTTQAID